MTACHAIYIKIWRSDIYTVYNKEIVCMYFERLKNNSYRVYMIKILKILLKIVDRYILNICILRYKNC